MAKKGKNRKHYTPKDLAPLTRTVTAWLWIFFGSQVLFGAAAVLELQAYASMAPDAPANTAPTDIVLMVGGAGLLEVVVYLVSGFLTLKWIYRASRNAHVLARGLEISPPWAVGFYFVPLASLWKPFQALREVWQVSARPDRWRSAPVPDLMRWWWGLWLISNFLGNGSFRLTRSLHDVSGQTFANYVIVADALASAAAAIALIFIVRRLSDMQTAALAAQTFDAAEPELVMA